MKKRYVVIKESLTSMHTFQVDYPIGTYIAQLENCIRQLAAGEDTLYSTLQSYYPGRFPSDDIRHLKTVRED